MERELDKSDQLNAQSRGAELLKQTISWFARPRVGRWLRTLVSVGLLVALFTFVDIQATLAIVSGLDPLHFSAAIVLSLLARFISAYRWYVLLHGKNPAVTYGSIVRLSFVSMFLGTFLPGAIGVEAVRVYGLSRETSDVHLSVTSVLLERLTGLFVLLLFVLTVLNWAPDSMPKVINYGAWIGFAGLILGSIVIMTQNLRNLLDRVLSALSLSFVRHNLDRVYECLDLYWDQKGLIVWSLFTAVIANVVRIATVWLCGLALGLDISIFYFIIFVPVIVLVGMFPISLGGLGVAEVTFVVSFGSIGLSAELGLALGLLFLLLNLIAITPGAWIYWRRGLHA